MKLAVVFSLNFKGLDLLLTIDLKLFLGLEKQLSTLFSASDVLYAYSCVTVDFWALKSKRLVPRLSAQVK